MKVFLLIICLATLAVAATPGLRANRQALKTSTVVRNTHHRVKAEDVPKELAPDEAVRSFYQWYLHALYQSPDADPFKEHKTDVEKYVTARLLQRLASSARTSTGQKGPDVDTEYFFGTLDLNSDWEKNITISNSTMQGVTAVVHIAFSGTNPESKRLEIEQEREVVLKQESGLWKIDYVDVWRE